MGLSGMIVLNEPWAVWLAFVCWVFGCILFCFARFEGAMRGTGWLALACGIFGAREAK